MTDEREFITVDCEGTEMEFENLGVFGFEGKEYIALAEMTEDGSDYTGDVFILGYTENGDDFDMEYIEDEAEYERVCAEFDRLMLEEI